MSVATKKTTEDIEAKLLQEYALASQDQALAVRDLEILRPHVTRAEYQRLYEIAENSRLECVEAHQKLQAFRR